MTNLHDARVEAAAKAMYGRDLARSKEAYPDRPNFWAKDRPTYAEHAALALAAADAVVTVEMIAEVLADHSYGYSISGLPLGCECGHDQGEDRHAAHQATYVLDLLRGGEGR